MSAPISALECEPYDLVREVSPEAINFYVDELSGIYLPDDFKNEHADVRDVEGWKPEDRLDGKFGRWDVRRAREGGESKEELLDGILLMGTTIGLSGLDRDGYMTDLRHLVLRSKVRDVLEKRNLLGEKITVNAVDYGHTSIKLDDDGQVEAIRVDDSSFDFGRANTEGRQETCDMFAQLLGDEIQVINADPEPREFDQIVG